MQITLDSSATFPIDRRVVLTCQALPEHANASEQPRKSRHPRGKVTRLARDWTVVSEMEVERMKAFEDSADRRRRLDEIDGDDHRPGSI